MSANEFLPTMIRRLRRSTRALAALALLAVASHSISAAELRLSTENDLLGNRRTGDDLYTFSLGLEAQRGRTTFALRENAFTDRAAGVRFDETYLSLGRPLPVGRGWSARGELGVVHVGRGLFGETLQNRVHRLVGSAPVELRYLGSSLHPHVALVAERPAALGGGLELGPRLELDAAPGLRYRALAALRATWRAGRAATVEAQLGARFAYASLGALAPHLDSVAAAARLGFELDGRYFLAWSYNDHGDRREHLTVGYRLGARRDRTSRSASRAGRE